MDASEQANFHLFREILATPLIAKSSTPSTKKPRKARNKKAVPGITTKLTSGSVSANISTDERERDDAAELSEFIDYTAHEIFTSFPADLRTLSYSAWFNSKALQNKYTDPLAKQTASSILAPLPPSIEESLSTYAYLRPAQTLAEFLTPILTSFVATLIAPPPPPSQTKELATECEICSREHIPLTYHHLIPRSVHAKVLKRGWHTEDRLNDVAWLCRACHSFVHSCASNEELAREWFTVERLLEREDVRGFAGWVGGVRWKKR